MLQIRRADRALLAIYFVCLPDKFSFKTIVAACGGLESRRLSPCHARVCARARTHPRPCAPPWPALSSTGHATGSGPRAHACRLDKHARADAWRNQNLRSTFEESRTLFEESARALGRCGATERQASLDPHRQKAGPRAPRRHALSGQPPLRAQMPRGRRECGRAELALRLRCFGCRSGGAVPRAKGLFWRLVP